MNPYEVMDTPVGATTGEIKQRFRKLAQKLHPDKKGGDVEKFKTLNDAYQILKNPARRARYDETGDLGDNKKNDPVLDKAAQLFSNIIDREQFLGDIITECKSMVDNARWTCDGEIAKAEAAIGKLEKQLNRITTKSEVNLFENLIRNKLDDIQKKLDHFTNEKDLLTGVKELLEDYNDESPQFTEWGNDTRV